MKSGLIALILLTASAYGASLKDCKAVYIHPMPEGLDGFIATEMLKWKRMTITTKESSADCQMSFGNPTRRKTKVESTSGNAVVATEAPADTIPSTPWGAGRARAATVQISETETGALVWAATARDNWAWSKGLNVLAKKLVGELKKSAAK